MSSHQSCETSLSSLTRVHFNVEEELAKSSARILDLEVSSMQQDEEVEKLVKVIEADSKEKNNLKAGLMATKNAIKVLDEQLFRRDDNILAYEMQLEFLEENEDDHQEHIMDLQNWNQRLKERNEELQLNMYSQQREAVAALGAVASSATVRKAKQFEHLRIAVQAEKDQMALEAASALNYIATAAKKIYKKELV
jgi:chromosome segregation ATPase